MRVKFQIDNEILDTFDDLDDNFFSVEQVYDLKNLGQRKASYSRSILIYSSQTSL